jgi:hypothetical protein
VLIEPAFPKPVFTKPEFQKPTFPAPEFPKPRSPVPAFPIPTLLMWPGNTVLVPELKKPMLPPELGHF